MDPKLLNDLKALLSADAVLTYNCGDGVCLVRFEHVDSVDFTAINRIADENGLVYRSGTALEHVRAVGFHDGQGARVRFLYDSDKNVFEYLYDPASSFRPALQPKTAGECPVRFWQFEIDHSLIDCGMCYIFQLSDYSFFLIDSAHQYSIHDDTRILSFLRERTPAGRPVVIRGWFFSHGHDDHIAKFLDVLQYGENVRIEAVYANFVPEEELPLHVMSTADRAFTRRFRSLTAEKQVPVFRPHTLDVFCVGDLRITVLCTHEDVFPLPLENYNDSSTVIMVEVGGDRILFPGDAGHVESAIMEERFPHSLACDIVQQAHHGHFGTTPRFYCLANAHVVLFPTTKIKYDEEYDRYPANDESVRIAKHCFIASDGTAEFTFPLAENRIRIHPDAILEDFNAVDRLWGYTYTDEYKQSLRARFAARQAEQVLEW